ncbi:hypothetical protein ACX31A_15330 [Dermacoccus nishinomiyaensis]
MSNILRRAIAVIGLLFTFAAMSAPDASAAAPIVAIGECYDAPMPAEPLTGMTWMPEEGKKWPNDKDHNPMLNPDPKVFNKYPPQMVYGYNPVTPIYDNGCGPIGGIMPGVGNSVGNMLGATIPATVESWGYGAMRSAIDPSWLGPLDNAVTSATKSVSAGTWGPFAAVTIMIVAAVVLWRSKSGELPAVVTGVVWMLGVLTFVTFTVNYPSEAPQLVDKGVQGATVQIANGFEGSGANGASKDAANAVDRMWGEVWMNTLYRTWAEATFGSANSEMAKKYGRELFDLEHFTISEWETYQSDPGGKGRDIAMEKKKRFDYVAQGHVKKEDPVAYDYLTGNRWGQRMTNGVISFVVTLGVVFFLLVASAALLISFLITRLLVPFAPAGGVIFMLDAFRDYAVKGAQKLAMILVAGPIMLVGALVVLRIDGAIWGMDNIPTVVQMFLVIATSVIAWKLLKPAQFMGRPHAPNGIGKVGSALRMLAAYRWGHSKGEDDEEEKKKKEEEKKESSKQSGPVALPPPLATGPFAAPPPASAEDVDATAGGRVAQDIGMVTVTPVRRNTPGTFVPRAPLEPGTRSARDNRTLSAASTAYDEDAATEGTRNVGSATTLPPAPRPRMVEAPTATSTYNADDSDADLDAPLDNGSTPPTPPDSSGGGATITPTPEAARRATFAPSRHTATVPTLDDPASTETDTETGTGAVDAPTRTADATVETPRHTFAPSRADAAPALNGVQDEGATGDEQQLSGSSTVPLSADSSSVPDEVTAHEEQAHAPEQVGTVRVGKRARSEESEAIEPSAIWSPATSHNVMDVDESNITYDDNGNPEFVIYHPSGSAHFGVE